MPQAFVLKHGLKDGTGSLQNPSLDINVLQFFLLIKAHERQICTCPILKCLPHVMCQART
eukprot:TCALIF_02348-PB protein Name:"Protein of unknown function" AED:0.49 eAED:1.00 QI:0/0/0/1/0/0/2/0/59